MNGPNGLQICFLRLSSFSSLSQGGPVHCCNSMKNPHPAALDLKAAQSLIFYSTLVSLGIVTLDPQNWSPSLLPCAASLPGLCGFEQGSHSGTRVKLYPRQGPSSKGEKGGPSTHHRISFLVKKVRAYNKPQRDDGPLCSALPRPPWGSESFGG